MASRSVQATLDHPENQTDSERDCRSEHTNDRHAGGFNLSTHLRQRVVERAEIATTQDLSLLGAASSWLSRDTVPGLYATKNIL